jgi:hypothetical protein
MRTLLVIVLFLTLGCKKTDFMMGPQPPVNQEESIKFKTNLDTGVNYVKDTLKLEITLTSKLPDSGLKYTVQVLWVDSNRSVYRLDTVDKSKSIVLNINGLNKKGTYQVSVEVASKLNLNNQDRKTLSVINDPLNQFVGYKVNQTELLISRQKNFGIDYWTNTGVMGDLMLAVFQKNINNSRFGSFFNGFTYGDMNNDGYIDVFNAGTFYQNTQTTFSFLIWDPIKKIYENKNLFNDKSFTQFGRNKNDVVPLYLNTDNYVDFVVVDLGDESTPEGDDYEPIRIVLSDGKGGYDLKEIETSENDFTTIGTQRVKNNSPKEDIAIGDLNEDNIPDLAILQGNFFYIFWGINSFPYFSSNNPAKFNTESVSLKMNLDNGFGENAEFCAGGVRVDIFDTNKDGKNDILMYGEDRNAQPNSKQFRVLLNLGKGRFNNSSVKRLPYFHPTEQYMGQDAIIDDINSDGLNDIIAIGHNQTYRNWSIMVYIKKTDGTYEVQNNFVQYTINSDRSNDRNWKPEIIYHDYNGDGIKDISYRNSADNPGFMQKKSVFIRKGNQFIEEDFFKYDLYSSSILSSIQ